ncbi:hypothetical protein BH09ACT4_BH09ACT4_13250 [soil metagenome]
MTDHATAAATSFGPAAGWYPDPADPTSSRWWSGEGWTDHVQPAAVAAVPVAAPVFVATPVLPPAPPAPSPTPVPTASNFDSDGVPLNLFADSVFAPEVLTGRPKPSSQSDWHAQSGRGVVPKRQVGGSVSLSTGSSTAAVRKHDPYRERNWIAGVALVLAILSIPALAVRFLVELPPVTQSVFGGAPIAISLLAVALSVRRGNGIVASIIAVVISGAVLAAGLLVDPAILKSIVDQVMALLP